MSDETIKSKKSDTPPKSKKPELSSVVKKLLGKKCALPEFSADETMLVEILNACGGSMSIKDLSRDMDKSAAGIIDLAESVRKKGIGIWSDKDSGILHLGRVTVELAPEDIPVKKKEIRISLIADSLLGSKYQQLENLHRAVEISDYKDVDVIIHLGVSAGKPTPAREEEFHQLTVEEQISYIVENYPVSKKGKKIRLISGYHDMQWRRSGTNVLFEVCNKRPDLIYRGDYQSDFPLRRGIAKDARWPILRAAYRGGDNSPYAKSYPVQGFQENLIQDISDIFEDDKPDIGVIAGQGVYLDLAGESIDCLVSIPGMRAVPPSVVRRKNRIVAPTIGFVILTIKFNDDGTFFVRKSVEPLKIKKNDYKVKYSEDKEKFEKLDKDERKVIKLLEESSRSHGELEQAIDKSPEAVNILISGLRGKGFAIAEQPDSKSFKLFSPEKKMKNVRLEPINFADYYYKTVKHGALSDFHVGSVADNVSIAEDAYDTFVKEKITEVDFVGDGVNGPPKHGEYMKGEVYECRATPLIDLFAGKFPVRKGIKTNAIAGNHDAWFMDICGLDIFRHIADIRPDINYLGICEGLVQDGKVNFFLKHYDWGTGYAKSHKPQAVVETILKEVFKEKSRYRGKVMVVLSGGGHVYSSMLLKGIVFILMPCLQGKTGFVNRLGKISDVGYIVYEITYSKNGELTEFSVDYYDRIAEARANERTRAASGRKAKPAAGKGK